ncbi:MAG: methionyl-tRNA formyltransferase [Candidatus Marinimicrobia bacterium]|nr:methionyl-tRNA formyltransferase [Candidatus Neomarinimicrobiota bacterium]
MNIIFMGTPDFAVPSLLKLAKSGYKPVAVVTGADKKRGRGQKLIPTPVKSAAADMGIPILEPKSLKDSSFIREIASLDVELSCVVAFRILPDELISIPKRGTVNLHASLLPLYRGAAPIQRAIMAGEKITGATTFFIRREVDTGNILLQKSLPLAEDEDFGSLHDRLAELGANLLLKTIEGIKSGKLKEIPQDDAKATNAPKIKSEDLKINWDNSAGRIHDQVRGLSPFPGVSARVNNMVIKIFKTEISDETVEEYSPGEISRITGSYFTVATGDGSLKVLELQRQGKRRMETSEFLRGVDLSTGDTLT